MKKGVAMAQYETYYINGFIVGRYEKINRLIQSYSQSGWELHETISHSSEYVKNAFGVILIFRRD
ncbi:hypothetical protein [Halobacillus sp. B29]|uniref:hypothetical protein n=1 Tax=Halobacillus sp. B29 TaxID=3457432 RepID=UPI003FCEE5C5